MVRSATRAGPVVYTARFTEAVFNLTTADFTVTNGTLLTVVPSSDNTTFAITVQPTASFEGSIDLSFKGAGFVTDAAGNLSVASGSEAAVAQAVDTKAPTLAPVGGSNPSWTAQLRDVLVDGAVVRQDIEVRFSEALSLANVSALMDAFSVTSAGYNIGVDSVSLNTAGTSVILALSQMVTRGLGVQLTYTNPSVDSGMGTTGEVAIEDLSGNDWASSTLRPGNISNVTSATAGVSQTRVFAEGKLGGTGPNTFTFDPDREVEYLIGGAGADTITVADIGSASEWLIGSWKQGAVDPTLPTFVQSALSSGPLFSFVNTSGPFAMAYVQAEQINVGSSSFTVTGNGVLQINGTDDQTLTIDTELLLGANSIVIGSGLGDDTIIDSTDWNGRSDTVVYNATALDLSTGTPMASDTALMASISQLVAKTSANTFQVSLGSQVDTLQGVERLRFETASGSVDVALVGTNNTSTAGLTTNGYANLAAAVADATSTQVVMVYDPALSALTANKLVAKLDGMFSTNASNDVVINLNGSSVAVNGLREVVFASSDPAQPVRVWVVGADGFATIDDAMALASRGDVIYIADNAITTPTTYVVQKEGMVFMGNSSTFNGNPRGADLLTLELGYVDLAAGATMPVGQDAQIKGIVLLGDADMTVIGNSLNNVIVGNRGDNTVYGGDGNDIVSTGGGSDQIFGEMGDDLLVADRGASGQTALLSGGAGNDLLVAATTGATAAKVVMTGGTGGDTFKVGSLASGNGALNLDVVINDLSARAGDDLDLSQVILAATGQSVTLADLSKNYVSGNQTFTFASATQDVKSAVDGTTTAALADLMGTLRVEMTTETNVATAFVNPGETSQPLSVLTALGQGAATDVVNAMTSSLSSAAEVNKLLPLFEHNNIT